MTGGSVPDSAKPSRVRPTGTPPEQVTPAHAGLAVQGLSLAEAQPTSPAFAQLVLVMAERNAYRELPALGGGGEGEGGLGGGGEGMGQLLPRPVLVMTVLTVPPAVALKRVGKTPHKPVFELSVRRVRAPRPADQMEGTVDVSWLLPRLRRTKLDKALQEGGRPATRLLFCSWSSVRADRTLHEAGRVPVMPEDARFRDVSVSTWPMEAGSATASA